MPAEEKRIHELTATATVASGSSFPLDKSGNAEALRITDANLALALFDLEAVTGKVAWVDSVNGSNTTGARGKAHLPFLTLNAAKTAAVSGDTVVVLPGTYSESLAMKDGVNWLFLPGSVVSSSAAPALSCTTGVTAVVRGWGTFAGTGAGGDGLIITGGTLSAEAVAITSAAGDGVNASLGTLTLQADVTASVEAIDIAGGSVVVRRSRLQSTTTHTCLVASGGLTLWDCVLIAQAASNSLAAAAPQSVRIYGHCMANKDKVANVTLLCGTLEVDTDVT